MTTLFTARLELVPVTLDLVEAVFDQRADHAERILAASLPHAWPSRSLIERAFYASIEAVRREPIRRLWGDRVMITRTQPRRVVGSVIFHGAPDAEGAVEVAYGVEGDSQRQGYAKEATLVSVLWALSQPEVHVVRASTPLWHSASQRVLEHCGLVKVGVRESELGEIWEYERRRSQLPNATAVESHPYAKG